MADPITVETLTGAAIAPWLAALARLRTTVFRAFPYLYDGNAEYEIGYLRRYIDSKRAAAVLARDGERAVGAATCLPMTDEAANITAPFRARGLDLGRFFYFGESVLLAECRGRGRGIGVAFFAHREAHALAVSDCDFACFCAVIRPEDHPARPADYVPLDDFWRHRGYVPRPDLACSLAWKEVGETAEGPKKLGFWMKSLTGAKLP